MKKLLFLIACLCASLSHQKDLSAAGKFACVALVPKEGALDKQSVLYSDIKEVRYRNALKEMTTLNVDKKPISLELIRGGCDHYTAKFTFVIQEDVPISNKDFYFDKAIDLIQAVKLKKKQTWNNKIYQAMQAKKDDKKARDRGIFVVIEGFRYASLYVADLQGGKKKLELAYDITL